jgi:serine/threonine-protein kinase
MADFPVTEGQILAGKYRLERVLGSGGSGFVVAAWNVELEQRVAMKFLHPLSLAQADTAERFRREARAAAKIHSEHVAHVIDVGIMEGGIPFIVMEYLEGRDLCAELAQPGLLPIPEALDFVLQAIEALAEAHSFGIVHRDLKPANLFIAKRTDGTRLVKVLDFGISKSLPGAGAGELSLTTTSAFMGSPLYMSPEHVRSSKDVDTRTDIWSLGVIMYEMLTKQAPFMGDSIGAVCAALLSDVPAPMRSVRADVAPELEAVILRCLAKNREERFSTVSELAAALAPFASPGSQLHVDRASRLLGALGLPPTPAARVGPSIPREPAPQSAHPAKATVDTWWRSDAPGSEGQSRQPSRAPLLVGLCSGLAGVLCAALLLGKRPAPVAANASLAVIPLAVAAHSALPRPTPPSAAPELISLPAAHEALDPPNAPGSPASPTAPKKRKASPSKAFAWGTKGFGGRR